MNSPTNTLLHDSEIVSRNVGLPLVKTGKGRCNLLLTLLISPLNRISRPPHIPIPSLKTVTMLRLYTGLLCRDSASTIRRSFNPHSATA
jgi:hypothetical protein